MASYKYDALSSADKKAIIAAFNEKSKRGIELLGAKLDITDPAQLAQEKARFFIVEKEGLDLGAIGDYLGTKGDENQKTLEAFLAQQDYQNLEFTRALRQFLTSFNLPVEAQKIDKLMEAFATRYVAQNPGKFSNADAAYVLAFSTIMLTTDLHNPEIKNKITLEEFIKNNRGTNDGSDFPPEFLTAIYHEIKQNAIKPNVAKIAPGFTLDFNNTTHHSQTKNLKKHIQKPVALIQKIFPDKQYTTEISTPKKWLNKLLGYEGTITIKDGKDPVATVQIYSPGLFSRNKNPKIIVQPTHDEANKANKNDINVAARIAASFGVKPTIAATYKYQQQELGAAYAKANIKPKPLSPNKPSTDVIASTSPQLLHQKKLRKPQDDVEQQPLLGGEANIRTKRKFDKPF